MKVKGVPFSQVKQNCLILQKLSKGMKMPIKNWDGRNVVRNERKSGVNKVCSGERMGLRPSAISRLESNPLGAV